MKKPGDRLYELAAKRGVQHLVMFTASDVATVLDEMHARIVELEEYVALVKKSSQTLHTKLRRAGTM